jgi:hypothetical protein
MPERGEPSVAEILTDPIVRALMAADGVHVEVLEALLRSVAKRLGIGADWEMSGLGRP